MEDFSNVKRVIINGQAYDIDGTARSLEEIKAVASEFDVSIRNATPVVVGDTVTFRYGAGTKGAEPVTTLSIEGRTFELEAGAWTATYHENPQLIKDALVSHGYPQLANASYTIANGIMSFTMGAGTKGC